MTPRPHCRPVKDGGRVFIVVKMYMYSSKMSPWWSGYMYKAIETVKGRRYSSSEGLQFDWHKNAYMAT